MTTTVEVGRYEGGDLVERFEVSVLTDGTLVEPITLQPGRYLFIEQSETWNAAHWPARLVTLSTPTVVTAMMAAPVTAPSSRSGRCPTCGADLHGAPL